jgi:Domain of unknown function (DUF4274)
VALFGKNGIFGKRASPTFRVKVRDRSQGDFDSEGRYYFKTVDYPTALLKLHPGLSIGRAKHLLNTEAPDFNPDPTSLFPKDFAFHWQMNKELVITEFSFQSIYCIDDVTIAGITTRMPFQQALGVYPALQLAHTYNQLRNLHEPHTWAYYRAPTREFDLQIGVKDGLVDAIALYLSGWIAEQARIEPERLASLKAETALRAARSAWQALTDPNERLLGWGQSRDMSSSGSKAWEWYVRRLFESGPDGWHEAANEWNWDNGVEPLAWIVNQNQCDKATALLIFHLGEPHYYAEKLAEGKDLADNQVYALLQGIRERWLAGFYHRSELALDVSEYDDPPQAGDSDKDFVAASMRRSQVGRIPPKGHFFKGSPHKRDIFS